MDLKEKDILIFKNGKKIEYSKYDKCIIDNFYDENLKSNTDDNYTIVDVLRPYYYSIKGTDNMLNVYSMTIEQLRDELRERRMQVNNLIQEIKRKNEIIEKYNNFYNKMMEENYNRRPKQNGKNGDASKKSRTIKKNNK